MRLVVLDTNVLVSAGIQSKGPSGQIVMEALDGKLHTATCPALIREYWDVLHRPRLARYGLPPAWVEVLLEESLHLPDPAPWPMKGPDPDDLVFLALAKAVGVILVTGNIADYPARIRSGVQVMKPADYLTLLRG